MGFFWLAYVFLWHTFTIKKIISLFSDITECSNLPDIFPDQTESTLSPETLSSFSWRNNIRSQNLGTSYVHCYSGIKGKTQKYMCVCVHTQLYLTLPDSMDCSLPNSSVRAIFSGEILEWVPIFSSRASFKPGHPTCISCSLQESTGRWILYQWTNREDPPVCIPTLYTRIYIDFF